MAGVPDYIERKGSLFLRSNHMNYGRATLNSNWHQAREAEPKDYDISLGDERNLCKATYNRIGDVTDGSLNKTTYQDHAEQTNLKKDFEEQVVRTPMMNMNTVEHAHLDRDLSTPQRGFGAVLPRHNPEYNKCHLETTHRADYQPPDSEYTPVPEKPADFPDLSAAYRKCNSQFTDTADYRRPGRNTWQDESGVYANTHYKQQVIKRTNPIPPQIS